MKSQKDKTNKSDCRKHSRSILFLASSCCILVCAFLLCTVCWAWFTSSAAAGFEIQTAMYGAKVTIARQGTTIADQQVISTYGNLWELENGYVYDVTITATGNAEAGHCKIILADQSRNTGNLRSGATLRFQISLSGSGTTWLQIMSSWGACNTYYYGAPITEGEVVAVGPVEIPPEPEQTPTEEPMDSDPTEEATADPTVTDAQSPSDDSTEQPTEDDTQPNTESNTEQPPESSTQSSDTP